MQSNFTISRNCIKKQSSLRSVVTALKKRNDKYFQYFRNDKVENQLCVSDINRYLKNYNYNSFEGVCVKSGAVSVQSSNTGERTIYPY